MRLRTTAIKVLAITLMTLFVGAAAQAGNEDDPGKALGQLKDNPGKKLGLLNKQDGVPVGRPVAGVPEPTGAAVFGLGAALMVGASRLRRRR